MYAGLAVDNKHETGFIAKEIRKHNYQTVIRLFTSLDDATFRAVLWDQAVHCLVWPPFVRYPGISETAKTDLRAYTAAGNNVVFIGNYVAVQFMNDVYGFQLMDDYQNGPYYRFFPRAQSFPSMMHILRKARFATLMRPCLLAHQERSQRAQHPVPVSPVSYRAGPNSGRFDMATAAAHTLLSLSRLLPTSPFSHIPRQICSFALTPPLISSASITSPPLLSLPCNTSL